MDHEIVNSNPFGWQYESKVVPIPDLIRVSLRGRILVGDASTCEVRVNNTVVWSRFNIFEAEYPIDLDVTMQAKPGDNLFTIGVSPLGGGIFTLTAVVEYSVTPPGTPYTPFELQWYHYVLIGLGCVAVIGGVYMYREERRREELIEALLLARR
jgi:hypothetical protein